MIELNKKVEQVYLNVEWCKKLTEAGVDMKIDAQNWIIGRVLPMKLGIRYFIVPSSELSSGPKSDIEPIPTYTLPELLYKIPEWGYWMDKKGEKHEGPIQYFKDAPFYGWYFRDKNGEGSYPEEVHYTDYPLTAAAQFILDCINNPLMEGGAYVADVSDK